MKLKKTFAPVMDYYRDLRFHNISSPKYRHLLLILFWPAFGVCFLTIERFLPMWFPNYYGVEFCTPVSCPWDALIPFHESFVIPYFLWFAFLTFFSLYYLCFDIQAFRKFMYFILFTYAAAFVFYIVWPTKQDLRPMEFTRDNFLVRIAAWLYSLDTNTNVCPSMHVLGMLAIFFSGMHSEKMRGWIWKTFLTLATIWVCAATLFLKQHSLVDVLVALGIGLICYGLQFRLYPALKKHQAEPPLAEKQH